MPFSSFAQSRYVLQAKRRLSVPPLVVWRKKHTVGKIKLYFDRGMESRYVLQAKRRLSFSTTTCGLEKKHTVGKIKLYFDRGMERGGRGALAHELYIYWSENFSHSANGKSETKMAGIDAHYL
jgi:hypothetical protein